MQRRVEDGGRDDSGGGEDGVIRVSYGPGTNTFLFFRWAAGGCHGLEIGVLLSVVFIISCIYPAAEATAVIILQFPVSCPRPALSGIAYSLRGVLPSY